MSACLDGREIDTLLILLGGSTSVAMLLSEPASSLAVGRCLVLWYPYRITAEDPEDPAFSLVCKRHDTNYGLQESKGIITTHIVRNVQSFGIARAEPSHMISGHKPQALAVLAALAPRDTKGSMFNNAI